MYKTYYPTSSSQIADGFGTLTNWLSIGNVLANDGVSASSSGTNAGGSRTDTLVVNNFAFNLPTSVVITGVMVEIARTTTYMTDCKVLLRKNGSVSANKVPAALTTAANGTIKYGGPGDLWGMTLSASDINDTLFGASYSAETLASSGNFVLVDFMRITVYYEAPTRSIDYNLRKRYSAFISNSSGYLGMLPNVYDNFEFTDEINTGGSDTTIYVALPSDSTRSDVTSVITDETGDPILTENSLPILAENALNPIAINGGNNLIANGNIVTVYEYSPYYPNGHAVFTGRIDKFDDNSGYVVINLKSYGLDLDNSILTGAPYTLTLDQLVTDPSPSFGTFYYTTSVNFQECGQSFTVGAGVTNLAAIIVRLNGSVAGTIALDVYDSSSLSKYYTGTTVVFSTIGSWALQQFTFDTPLAVTPGQKLFFRLRFLTAGGVAGVSRISKVYAGGQLYFSFMNIGANPSGGFGFTATNDTMWFQTYSGVGSTTITYPYAVGSTVQRIDGMAFNALTNYQLAAGNLSFTNASINTPNAPQLKYKFTLATMLEAMNKFTDLAAAGTYWYVDRGTGLVSLLETPTTADYTLIKNVHIADFTLTATTENVINRIYFTGGQIGQDTTDPLNPKPINFYKVYEDATSIAKYGARINRVTDNRVTLTATADAICQSSLADNKDEKYMVTLTVIDKTMDISLLQPGKVIGFANFNNYKDSLKLQIVRRNFRPGTTTITLGVIPQRQSDMVEQITRGLIAQQTIDNPALPS